MLSIILDLDNTLISALSFNELQQITIKNKELQKFRESSYAWLDMDNSYRIFERPQLQNFLTYVFRNFKVSVWTAASKQYAIFIIKNIILGNQSNRKLEYVFFSHHCRTKNMKTDKSCNNYKNLNLLNDEFRLNFDLSKTFIIDDHPNVCKIQPDRCLAIKAFNIEEELPDNIDDSLISIMIPKLDSLKKRLDL